MPNLQASEVVEVHVGDAQRPLSYQFLEADRSDARVLSGWGALVRFWYEDAAIHILRQAEVDQPGGVALYDLRGDEFTVPGVCLAQFTIRAPAWYGGGTAAGRYFVASSSDILRFNVIRRPT